jgi:serine/threonine protein kinase
MAQFDPSSFVGQDLEELVAFLQVVDQASLAVQWRRKIEWLISPKVKGGKLNDPVALPNHILFPDDMRTDIPENHPPISIPSIEIMKYLGGGQSGWVYAGKVKATGLLVAVKILRNDSGRDLAGFAANEAAIGSRLKHRNIMGVYDLRSVGNYWIILMELVAGQNLAALAKEIREIKRVYGLLCDALLHMGQVNIVHRDIKPENIILRRNDLSPVIVDFGLSVDIRICDLAQIKIAGSPLFMPPEAFDGIITTAFDAYSLGVTAAIAISGRGSELPSGFNQVFRQKRSGTFQKALLAMLEGMDSEISDWIIQLTETELDARHAGLDCGQAWGSGNAG